MLSHFNTVILPTFFIDVIESDPEIIRRRLGPSQGLLDKVILVVVLRYGKVTCFGKKIINLLSNFDLHLHFTGNLY